eukprot:g66242.t1
MSLATWASNAMARATEERGPLPTALNDALVEVARLGKEKECRQLLESRACVDSWGQGMTALMWASAEGHKDVISLLLQHNAEVGLQEKDGSTALHLAVLQHGFAPGDAVTILLDQGLADTLLRNGAGRSPLDYAQNTYGGQKLAAMLNEHMTRSNQLCLEVRATLVALDTFPLDLVWFIVGFVSRWYDLNALRRHSSSRLFTSEETQEFTTPPNRRLSSPEVNVVLKADLSEHSPSFRREYLRLAQQQEGTPARATSRTRTSRRLSRAFSSPGRSGQAAEASPSPVPTAAWPQMRCIADSEHAAAASFASLSVSPSSSSSSSPS